MNSGRPAGYFQFGTKALNMGFNFMAYKKKIWTTSDPNDSSTGGIQINSICLYTFSLRTDFK